MMYIWYRCLKARVLGKMRVDQVVEDEKSLELGLVFVKNPRPIFALGGLTESSTFKSDWSECVRGA